MSIIIDKNADFAIFDELCKRRIKYYKSFDMKMLYHPVNTHPDMQIHFASEKIAFVAPAAYKYYCDILPAGIKLISGENDPQKVYPGDCAYNIATIGKNAVGNFEFADKKIVEYYYQNNYNFINTKQGYTKCNLCVTGENSAVTEDENLFKVLTAAGINVLKLKAGEISLAGFDYGFIGGASGFIKKNKLAFFGDFSKCSYYNELKNFLKSQNVEFVTLSKIPPTDYGSILYF